MKKKHIIMLVALIALASCAFTINRSGYSDEQIKKIAFTESISNVKIFLLMVRPVTSSISRNYKSYNVSRMELRKLITAMVCLETGHLKSNALQVNNLTGIKAISSRPKFTFMTTEFVKGKMIHIDQDFSAFFSFEDSIDNLFKVWSNSRYAGLHKATNAKAFILALGKSGYATDPEYGNKILKIYNELK